MTEAEQGAAPAATMSPQDVKEMIDKGQVLTKPGQGMEGASLDLIEIKIESPKESGNFMITRMKKCPKEVTGSLSAIIATLHQSMTSYEVLMGRFQKTQKDESLDSKKQIEAWEASAELEERFLKRTLRLWNQIFTALEPFYNDGEKLEAYKMEQLGVFVVQYLAQQQLSGDERKN